MRGMQSLHRTFTSQTLHHTLYVLSAKHVSGTAVASRKNLITRTSTRPMAAQAASETQKKYTLKTSGGGTYKVAAGEQLNVATAGAQAAIRAGSGAFVSDKLSTFKNRPEKPIELYEFEGCPFCRKVREACSILDIDIQYYPCPKDGPTWRVKKTQETGRGGFPYMVDPNTGKKMHESADIIQYLFEQYGDGDVPPQFKLGPLSTLTAGLGLLPRAGKGTQYRRSKLPEKSLEIWGYEASPFVKIAREALVELEIPHIYHTVARNSPKRDEMTKKWDQFQVPYLEDPNTGIAMFESNIIVEYLDQTYAVA